jgi:hypothetical protein
VAGLKIGFVVAVACCQPKTLADMGDPEMPLTAQEFLNALPKSVIKNGSVIDVRSGVAGMLKGPSGASDDTPGVVVAQTEGSIFHVLRMICRDAMCLILVSMSSGSSDARQRGHS